mmetsp:Transcript_12844/g.25681  ORF Transcript_12844/g.25681 Transcript_12844/m.25681 type:complete len:216 (+) Transcript_12844:639-1286(+)
MWRTSKGPTRRSTPSSSATTTTTTLTMNLCALLPNRTSGATPAGSYLLASDRGWNETPACPRAKSSNGGGGAPANSKWGPRRSARSAPPRSTGAAGRPSTTTSGCGVPGPCTPRRPAAGEPRAGSAFTSGATRPAPCTFRCTDRSGTGSDPSTCRCCPSGRTSPIGFWGTRTAPRRNRWRCTWTCDRNGRWECTGELSRLPMRRGTTHRAVLQRA